MNEYRITRSRRPIGMNWLVQQGQWNTRTSTLSGKTRRVFVYVREMEFPTRRHAAAFLEAEELRLAGQEAECRDARPTDDLRRIILANRAARLAGEEAERRDARTTDAPAVAEGPEKETTMKTSKKKTGPGTPHCSVAYSGEAVEVLQDVLQDSLSPQAIAVIAGHLHGMVNTKSESVNREVAWFTEQLLDMVGDQYNALCEEAGL